MTLTPQIRLLLTDALRPPAGYRVHTAVGTTYSLDLTALLLAPLSFAVFDQATGNDISSVDPVRLLEAVRRHSEHTTMFCQTGGISVPSDYRSILTFVEDSIHEVMPHNEHASFHPKIWALRFTNQAGDDLHRLVVLSRNMTFDRSWDTALVLDEAEDGAIDGAPAADFIQGLPNLAIRDIGPERRQQIQELAANFRNVRFEAPSPFTGGHLLPMGMTNEPTWPFPDHARRLLAISPFLTKAALKSMGRISNQRTLLSRPQSLDQLGSVALKGWTTKVFQRLAEVSPDDLDEITDDAPSPHETNEGLHAKTFIFDLPKSESMMVTGSANLTEAGWERNVEFGAVLTGHTGDCGVTATLDDSPQSTGLDTLLEKYSPATEDGRDDSILQLSLAIEQFHRELALTMPALHITAKDDEQVEARLNLLIPDDAPGRTRVWLPSLPGDKRELAETLTWTLAPVNITPFIAVETTAGHGATEITRRCVIKAELTGAADQRRQDAVFEILRSKEQVLRYLVFLLGDPSYGALFAHMTSSDSGAEMGPGHNWSTMADVALLEPLVRACGRDEDSLARVASLVSDLRDLPRGSELVPDGFEQLWDIVWQAHQELTK